MREYTLYCFAQSGNAYKVALMLNLCGADWQPRFVDYFNGETRTPSYRRLNVMGEVPVLVHGALYMCQSGVILDYLAQQLGRFGAENDDERREILRWLLFDNHKFTSYTATLRYLRSFSNDANPAVVAEFAKRAEAAWSVLNAHLEGRDWVLGHRPTIADFSLAGYVYFPDEIGVDWSAYPSVANWSARLAALPRWQHPYDLMPGHPLSDRLPTTISHDRSKDAHDSSK